MWPRLDKRHRLPLIAGGLIFLSFIPFFMAEAAPQTILSDNAQADTISTVVEP